MNNLVITKEESDIVSVAQKAMQTNYQTQTLVNMIASNIAVGKQGGTVTSADVLQVVKIASSMHLDPILGGVWAFKDKNGRLTCGISKKGWQQALHSQPDFCGITFENIGQLKEKTIKLNGNTYHMTYYEACKCTIKKQRPDGSYALFEGTAYFDEEFMANKETWLLRPKRMLEGRAMTICASNCYGWGAYDLEEVKSIQSREMVDITANVVENSQPVATKAKQLISEKKRTRLLTAMKSVKTKDELSDFWRSLDTVYKEDEEFRTTASEIAKVFNEEEEKDADNL